MVYGYRQGMPFLTWPFGIRGGTFDGERSIRTKETGNFTQGLNRDPAECLKVAPFRPHLSGPGGCR